MELFNAKNKKLKQIAKVLAFVFVFAFTSSWGQAVLPLTRTLWQAEPAGWTNSGCSWRNTIFACTGSDATTFDNTGDSRTVFFGSAPNQLVFKLKRSSMSGASSLLVQESPDGSTWTNIGNYGTAGGSTAITDCADITLTLNCLSRYVRWTYTKANGNCDMDDVSISSYVGVCGSTNTITTGSVSNPPFALTDCTITATGNVAFTSSGTFVAGNIYTAQLSNAVGSFASAVNVGTLSSTSNSGTIPITIPAGTPSGTGYLIRVVSSNPSVTGSNSAVFTITLTCVTTTVCPSLLGVLINGCSGSCSGEGNNEFVVMSSGSYSIPVNATNINLSYDNGSAINFTGGFTPQPGDITNLNTLAGCGVFVDASAGTIPANSTFIVMNSGSCFNSGFNSFCGSGTIYVVFSNDADWIAGGFFANSGASVRSFITNFSALTGGTCGTTTYTYLPDNLTGGDGGSVSYSSPGGSPSYLPGTGTCAPQLTILPIDLIDFYATQNGSKNDLIWKVASEKNVSQYMIEKSEDGINFKEMVRLNSSTNEGHAMTYIAEDEEPYSGITYYRLSTIEINGKTNQYKIIDIDRGNKFWKSLIYQNDHHLVVEFKNTVPKNSTISLFDLSGKLLAEENIKDSQTKIHVQNLAEGLYFVKIQSPYKTDNFKIIIQK
jgi:hypothetical protein